MSLYKYYYKIYTRNWTSGDPWPDTHIRRDTKKLSNGDHERGLDKHAARPAPRTNLTNRNPWVSQTYKARTRKNWRTRTRETWFWQNRIVYFLMKIPLESAVFRMNFISPHILAFSARYWNDLLARSLSRGSKRSKIQKGAREHMQNERMGTR